MNNHKNCPICKQEVISDASKSTSCALCGMVIERDKMISLVREVGTKYFCLNRCYEIYFSINKDEESI